MEDGIPFSVLDKTTARPLHSLKGLQSLTLSLPNVAKGIFRPNFQMSLKKLHGRWNSFFCFGQNNGKAFTFFETPAVLNPFTAKCGQKHFSTKFPNVVF